MDDELIRALWQEAQLTIPDQDDLQSFKDALEAYAATGDEDLLETCYTLLEYWRSQNQAARLLPFHPLIKPLEGEVTVGAELQSKHEVKLFNDELAHMLVVGKSQQGKTNLTYCIAIQCMEQGIPVWFFDIKKDARHLIPKAPQVYALRLQDFKHNPLEPPVWEKRRQHWLRIWEIFCQQEALMDASENTGFETVPMLEAFYQRTGRIPTLYDLHECLEGRRHEEKTNTSTGQALDRMTQRLNALLTVFPETFACEKGYPLDELMKESIAFEYDDVLVDEAKFVILSMLFWAYHSHIWREQTKRSAGLRHLIIIDEAGQLINALGGNDAIDRGVPFINSLVDRCKEFGMGLMVCNQSVYVSRSIRVNSMTTLALNTLEAGEREVVGDTMSLDGRQREYLINMQPGSAILRLSGRWPEPIAIKIHWMGIKKTVSQRQVDEHNKSFLERLNQAVIPYAKPDVAKEASPFDEVDGRILAHLAANPFSRVRDLDKALGIATDTVKRHLDKMEGSLKAIKRFKVAHQQGQPVVIELLEPALEWLKRKNIAALPLHGRIVHAYWIEKIRQAFTALSYTLPANKDFAPGIFPDVWARKPGENILVEVECHDQGLANLQKYASHWQNITQLILAVDDETYDLYKDAQAGEAVQGPFKVRLDSLFGAQTNPAIQQKVKVENVWALLKRLKGSRL